MVDQISQLPTGALEFATLSAKVKALTSFLMDGAILPETLKQHGKLLLAFTAFTAGAATASAIFPYFNRYRNNRAKVNLAVFHITRIIEKTPEYQDRIYHPHELVRVMDAEVQRLLQVHLNQQEAEGAMIALKRKLWVEIDEERALVAKRRKSEIAERKDSAVAAAPEMEETHAELPQPSPTTSPAPEVFKPSSSRKDKLVSSAKIKEKEDSIMADVDALVETLATPLRQERQAVATSSSAIKTPSAQISQTPQHPLSSVLESSKQSPGQTFLDYTPVMEHAASPFPSYTPGTGQAASPFPPYTPLMEQVVSSSPSLPARPPTRRGGYGSSPPSTSKQLPPSSIAQAQAVHASPGYGLNYDDGDLYSSSPAIVSTNGSPMGQQISVHKPLSTLQQALIGARNLNTPAHMPSDPPVTENRKTSKPPSTVKIQKPPNSMAVRTGNEDKGTWLGPIQEGASPHESPAPGTTQYRVAESKSFYKKIVDSREERRDMRKFFKQEDELVQEVEASPAQEGTEWPDATLTYSIEEASQASLGASLSTIRSIPSPPSASAISLPRPSPPDQPQTPLQASPLLSSDPPLPPSDANFSPPVEPKDEGMDDVINVGSGPVTKDEDMDDVVFVSSAPARRKEVTPLRITPSPPKKRGRPKKVVVIENQEMTVLEMKPDTPMPAKSLGRSTKAAGKLQAPDTPVVMYKRGRRSRSGTAEPQTPAQAETPSGRAQRARAFRGSYKT